MPGRSHLISDNSAAAVVAALKCGQAVETIPIELNGEGSGDWEVTINVAQVVALIRHPDVTTASPAGPSLRLVQS